MNTSSQDNNNNEKGTENNNIKNIFNSQNINSKKNEFYYDTDQNKYYITMDGNSKPVKSNLFGIYSPQFKLDHTGFATYENRVKKHTQNKMKFYVDNSLYHPQTKFFEGYSQFSNPLSPPFFNLKINQNSKKNMANELKKSDDIITTKKNKKIFNQTSNNGLYFYTGTVNNIVDKKNKDYVLKSISNAIIEEKKNAKNFKIEAEHNIHALTKLKQKMCSNSTNKINGRLLKKPLKKFFEKFDLYHYIYFENPIQKSKEKSNYVVRDSDYYVSDFYNTLNTIKNKPKKKIKKNCLNYNIIISQNSDSNLNDVKEEINYMNNNKDILKLKKTGDENLFKKSTSQKKIEFCTIKTEAEILAKEPGIIDKKTRKILRPKKLDIHTFSSLKTISNLEKKMLKGFIKPVVKQESIHKKFIPKYNSTVNIIKKEMEMLKIVNPLRVKLDKENELKEIKIIKDKIEKSRCHLEYINNIAKNVNKVKKLNKIDNNKSKCFSTSNIFSKEIQNSKISKDYY